MGQDAAKWVEKLNDLIAVDIDAVNAYQACIDRLRHADIKQRLGAFQQDHERHIRELSAYVTRFGGKPRSKADIKGFFLKGFTAVTSMVGDEAALKAMQGNEQITNRSYQASLAEAWPDDLRQLIARNYGDEQRHLAYIREALQNRAWEQQEPVQHA
jgi:uncharacterized protein (TIGR02284 family)